MADSFDAQMFEQMRLLSGEQAKKIQQLRNQVAALEKQIREFPATACELQDKVTALEVRLSAVASIEELRGAFAKIAGGQLELCAPCDGMVNEWTQEQKDGFNAALAKAFGWKQQARDGNA